MPTFNVTPRVCDDCCDLGGRGGGSEPTEEVGVGSCSLSAIDARGVTMTEVPGEDPPVDFVTVSEERLRSKMEGALMVDDSLGIWACEGLVGAEAPGSFNDAVDFDGVGFRSGCITGSLGTVGAGGAAAFCGALLFED